MDKVEKIYYDLLNPESLEIIDHGLLIRTSNLQPKFSINKISYPTSKFIKVINSKNQLEAWKITDSVIKNFEENEKFIENLNLEKKIGKDDEKKIEEKKIEEKKIEEKKIEEKKIEEKKIEEKKTDEKKTDEKKTDEKKTGKIEEEEKIEKDEIKIEEKKEDDDEISFFFIFLKN
jgi:flagellar biosynthesis GTPase FlhF